MRIRSNSSHSTPSLGLTGREDPWAVPSIRANPAVAALPSIHAIEEQAPNDFGKIRKHLTAWSTKHPEEITMRKLFTLTSLALAIFLPSVAATQDARSILKTVREKQVERWEGVKSYAIDQSIMGNRAQSYFTRAEVEDSRGVLHPVFRPNFGNSDACADSGEKTLADASPEELEQIADAYQTLGEGMGNEIENGLEEAGLPRGLLAATGSDPWASFDPRVMMGSGATMYRGLAQAKRQRAIDDAAPDDSLIQQDLLARNAKLIGVESIDGRSAFHVRADDLNLAQAADGEEFTVHAISMWIDTDMFVPLKMKMDGVATSGRESRPITMERLNLDYRPVPDSNMYESYRQVSKISGVMNAEQQAQMQEAQQQMAEFEKQLAAMPASQRDMIMRQMGPQMDMMKNMASGGGLEMVTEVHQIVVNQCDRDQPFSRTVSMGGASMELPSMTAAAAGAASTSSYKLTAEDDDVEVRPYYIDEKGIGVLRYSEPAGRAFKYNMVISGLTANPQRPREVLVGSMGPYVGPDVGIYIGSLNMMGVPLDQLEIELYEDQPYRSVVRFRPVVDADKAESMADCGTVSATGACSNTLKQ
jgi:hypothetical protein